MPYVSGLATELVSVVSEYTGIEAHVLRNTDGKRASPSHEIAKARRLGCVLARHEGATLKEAAAMFGFRAHASVIAAERKTDRKDLEPLLALLALRRRSAT